MKCHATTIYQERLEDKERYQTVVLKMDLRLMTPDCAPEDVQQIP